MSESNWEFFIPKDEIEFGEYIVLGEGFASVVYKATRKTVNNNIGVAVKFYQRLESQREEACILKDLDHKNIIKFYGLYKPHGGVMSLHGIVLELASEGNLSNFLTRNREQSQTAGILFRLPESQFVQWSIDIASALQYLHKKNIIHKDIKSPNVLLSDVKENGFNVLKLCDFGSCKELQNACTTVTAITSAGGFTRCWAAPEVLQHPRIVSKTSDVYSFCVVLWELWTCQEPWKGFGEVEMIMNVINGTFLEIPNDFPEVLRPMIKQCWSSAGVQRCEIDEVLEYLEKFRRFLIDNGKSFYSTVI
ncbi:mitogen-activated protein kinase kinase kinase zak-1-like [Antedon mediterranea]|uniref:mitogen-activated protein kinase kinase kinase zak-1-like n=1 Tax=Antedon mediterranea TaxID=105859 RepID=UPI003AF84CBB